ncbi:MAG: hypothetical protein LBT50_11865 [Prevotellaceae bacterium]|nr:hypothetical protein [Prevotellaceae bacterium]
MTAILLMFGMSIRYSIDGYGIKKISLHPEVWAQTNNNGGSSSGGSSSGGDTSGGSSSGGGYIWWRKQ